MASITTEVAVVGGGLGGIALALRLKHERVDFLVLDKADGVGGTWRANTYPGAACDIPGHLYWYDLATVPADEQPDWERVYPTQREILTSIEALVRARAIDRHVRSGVEVLEAQWRGDAWHLRTAGGDRIVAELLVTATGQLSRPALPDVPGRDSFAGPAFHTARWDHEIDLRGKRVACIGAAASAVQCIPTIAPVADRVTVFQRSPNHLLPRLDRSYTADERRLFRDPAWRATSRQTCYEWQEALYRAFRTGVTGSDAQGYLDTAREHLAAAVSCPELRAKLWPEFAFGCKRPLICDDFYPTLMRDNVELVTDRIDRIGPPGVYTRNEHYPVDVIIYATGFEAQSFVGNLAIHGLTATLAEAWHSGVVSYNGVMVTGFPNMFMIYGPYSGLGHNSVLLTMENQADFIMQARRALRERGRRVVDVSYAAMLAADDRIATRVGSHVWGRGCASWWKDANGRVTAIWPGDVADHRAHLQLDPAALTWR